MNRRGFLKLIALAMAALTMRLSFPWAATAATEVSFAGKRYRAGGQGRILVSTDSGSTWGLHSDLGDIYTVTNLTAEGKKHLRATLAFGGRSFGLALAPDHKRWLTI